MAGEPENLPVGPEWSDTDGSWHYQIKDPKGGVTYTLSVLPEERSKKVILTLWRGGPAGPADGREAMSDPINITESRTLWRYHETVGEIFDDRPMAWFYDYLEWLRKYHNRELKKRQRQRKLEMQKRAERKIKGTPYHVEEDGGLGMVDKDAYVSIANFSGRITEELTVDTGEGIEAERFFRVSARLRDEPVSFEVPANEFDSMSWIRKHLGARAIVNPAVSKGLQHTKTAFLEDGDPKRMRAFGHSGWREIGGRYGFLHASGSIFGWQPWQPFGEEVRVRPEGLMEHRSLPTPANDASLREALGETLKFWDAAPDRITIPTDAAAKRAALGEVDFSLHLGGPTGVGKTALALLAASYFGTWPRPADQHASYYWSAGRVEKEAYLLKDAVLVLDEFLPWEPLHKEVVDRILRNAANRSGRGTLTRKRAMEPRALIISTGEDFPSGESLEARVLAMHVSKGDINVSPGSALRRCSKIAERGIFAHSAAGFLAWVAERGYVATKRELEERRAELEESVWNAGIHPRLSGIYGDLVAAQELWLEFVLDMGVIGKDERDERVARASSAIHYAMLEHAERQAAEDPTRRFAELLGEALATGKGHLRREDHDEDCEQPGVCLGWVIQGELYLYPGPALTLAKEQAGCDAPFRISQQMLNRRLAERGLLVSTNPNKSRGIPVRKTIDGATGAFLHLREDFLDT